MKKILLILANIFIALNAFGSDEIDWDNLNRAKPDYCSTPIFSQWYEDNNWKACKIHDQQVGIFTICNKKQADLNFLHNCLNQSEFEYFKNSMCYISYWWVKYLHKEKNNPKCR